MMKSLAATVLLAKYAQSLEAEPAAQRKMLSLELEKVPHGEAREAHPSLMANSHGELMQ